jgi:hypothetical protein
LTVSLSRERADLNSPVATSLALAAFGLAASRAAITSRGVGVGFSGLVSRGFGVSLDRTAPR